jgi:HSP20 family molecular chaperone IbpA
MPIWRRKDDRERRSGERPEDWERDVFADPFFDTRSDPFRDFDDQFRRMRAYMDSMMEKAASGELRTPGEGGPFVYGWSMRVGPDGLPHVQTFGNVRPRAMRGGMALPAGIEGTGRRAQRAGSEERGDGSEELGDGNEEPGAGSEGDEDGEEADGPEDAGSCERDLMAMPGVREPLTDICDGEKDITVIAEMPGIERDNIELETGEDFLVIKVAKGDRKFYKELPLDTKVVPNSARAKYNNGVLEITVRKAPGDKKGTRVKVE